MPVPNSMSDLSTTAASNGPVGTGESPNVLDDYQRALAAIVRRTNSKGADIAAAATTDLSLTTDEFVTVTGSATITSFGTMAAGIKRTLQFSGACTITHNATTLICPNALDLSIDANGVMDLRSLGGGNWIVTGGSAYYQRFGTWTPIDNSGAALAFSAGTAGYYTKIGRLVFWQALVVYPTTANTANASIAGLPFVIAGSTGVGRAGGTASRADGGVDGVLQGVDSTTSVALYAGTTRRTNADVSGATLYISGFYTT